MYLIYYVIINLFNTSKDLSQYITKRLDKEKNIVDESRWQISMLVWRKITPILILQTFRSL